MGGVTLEYGSVSKKKKVNFKVVKVKGKYQPICLGNISADNFTYIGADKISYGSIIKNSRSCFVSNPVFAEFMKSIHGYQTGETFILNDVNNGNSVEIICTTVEGDPAWQKKIEQKKDDAFDKFGVGAKTPKKQKTSNEKIKKDPLSESEEWFLSFDEQLTKINPLFKRSDFHPKGFMYQSPELYNKGTLPFLPYLTPARSQGKRGTCITFAEVGAAELLGLKLQDLSEQHRLFLAFYDPKEKRIMDSNEKFSWRFGNAITIGLENEWPYNPSDCVPFSAETIVGNYVVNSEIIPCTNYFWQGILQSDGTFDEKPSIKGSKAGNCVLGSPLKVEGTDEEKINLFANILLTLKYPILFDTYTIYSPKETEAGFSNNQFNSGAGHAMLLVGFIHKDNIPKKVKTNPYFVPNEHYFIYKNSHGKGFGDNGFGYIPASVFVKNSFVYSIFKYDINSEVYQGCEQRSFAGVGE